MKKYIYILSTLLCIAFFTSCEVESSEGNYNKTTQGRIASSKIENTLNDYVYITDMIAVVDFYAEADEKDKEGIRIFYLPEYEITKTPNTWVLKNNKAEWTLTHNNKSINETGAIWTVKLVMKIDNKNSNIISEDEFKLESRGDKNWKLKISNMIYGISGLMNNAYYNNYIPYLLASTKTSSEVFVTASLANNKASNLYNYKINGGSGEAVSTLKMSFEIGKPLEYTLLSGDKNLLLTKGELDITVDDGKNNIDKVTEVVELIDNRISREITFNGITEEWGY